jgi:hypothetical protein
MSETRVSLNRKNGSVITIWRFIKVGNSKYDTQTISNLKIDTRKETWTMFNGVWNDELKAEIKKIKFHKITCSYYMDGKFDGKTTTKTLNEEGWIEFLKGCAGGRITQKIKSELIFDGEAFLEEIKDELKVIEEKRAVNLAR